MGLKYLHTMVRVKDLEASLAFYTLLGLKETRRKESENGRFTLIFIAPEGQEDRPIELTYNWDGDDGLPNDSRHFGHLAFGVEFIRSPDNISIELLQNGPSLEGAEPWLSMGNTGHW